MKRCPACGATSSTDDRFCEVDGAVLAPAGPAASAGGACSLCGEGTVEPDGFCSSCGRRPGAGPSSPAPLPAGAALAGGTVVSGRSAEEHLVRLPGGSTVLVALGEASLLDREAEALGRMREAGPFPGVVARGVDATHGPFLALSAPPGEARPVADLGAGASLLAMAAVVRGLTEAAAQVERLGYAWEPHRDDVFVGPDGVVRLSRLRIARKLGPGERLDARAVIEAVGPTFVPGAALDWPSPVFRLLLPHVAVPGDSGSSIDDVRADLAAILSDEVPAADDGSRTAGVCDPGLRRPHNEDAMASARGVHGGEPWTVLVVCDGVSSSSHAEQASAIAAKTACDALAHFAASGDVAFEAGAAAVASAIRAAHVAVCAQGIEASASGDPPGTTIVAGLLWRRRLTVGWVGDSRAYWVSDQGAELLTHDHSWVNEAVARGEVTEAEAAASPLAHALTRCLGPLEVADPDDPHGGRRRIADVQPDVRARDLPGPGWVVLCSDGFWNYFSPASAVAELVRSLGPAPLPSRVARRLVNQALGRGGQDNTTVMVHLHR